MTKYSRRQFLLTSTLASAGLFLTDALWIEKFFIQINEYNLPNKSGNTLNVKLVQLSDLHLKSLRYPLIKLAEQLTELKPDCILITGDAVDNADHLPHLDSFLSLLPNDIVKAAILGNWEYWAKIDLQKLSAIYRKHNCDLLINQSKQYSFGSKTFTITGVDDYLGGSADIHAALKTYQPSDYHVILNHCPQYTSTIRSSVSNLDAADLILSGHTHGGQLNLFGFTPFLPNGSGDFVAGWYFNSKPYLYVSKGIGTSILPVRFGARAEVAIFNF